MVLNRMAPLCSPPRSKCRAWPLLRSPLHPKWSVRPLLSHCLHLKCRFLLFAFLNPLHPHLKHHVQQLRPRRHQRKSHPHPLPRRPLPRGHFRSLLIRTVRPLPIRPLPALALHAAGKDRRVSPPATLIVLYPTQAMASGRADRYARIGNPLRLYVSRGVALG